ncbi:hypothetical protein ACMXYV_01135 [Neptuniibacter sp. SY11_33]|uniref:hypothetical protein n=1 Tax=Neptuniibacter sp. SY11_33 TaxID=3398215 RepID=UPI0039F47B5E
MTQLTEMQVDYIQEMFNTGLGDAAVELSELVNEEVLISVPKFDLLTRDELIKQLGIAPEAEVTTVTVGLAGDLGGNGMLIFPTGRSLDLVRSIVGETTSADGLTELEAEVLTEVASIILNQIISTIASLLSVNVRTELPVSDQETLKSALYRDAEAETVMFVGMSFAVQELNLRGDILFLQTNEMVEKFIAEVARVLEELGF